MARIAVNFLVMALSITLIGGVVACAEKSPEERVASLRAKYTASLNGFFVKEEPMPMDSEEVVEGESVETDMPAPVEESTAGDDVDPIMEIPDTGKDVLLDFVVRQDSAEKLPGITVEISQADAQGVEKGHWRHWIDTSELEKGPGLQFSHTLEGIDYEEGDGFNVSIRQVIPPEEMSEYREFQQAG